METVKLEMVCKNYGDIEALKEVTYAVNEERLALLGHNGAGKSTTFGLLSGQLTADSGQVFL
jgi:ABC-type multidrug transport system ATPase subunit